MRLFVLAMGCLVACDSSEVKLVVECPECGPGEVRYGLEIDTLYNTSIAARSGGGIAIAADHWFALFDQGLVEESRTDLGGTVVLAGDGETTYAVRELWTGSSVVSQLYAYEADGEERWSVALPDTVAGWQGLIASADGPIVTSNTFEAIALSASDGTQRWTQQNAGFMRAAAGGSVRLTSGQTATATVSSLHPGGDERWRQTFSADSRVWLHDATAMPDGSLIVTGRFERTNLRVGDLTLDGADPISFIAGLDSTGSARWGLTVPSADVLHVVENHGDIVIAGRYWGTGLGLPEADEAESFVAVVTPEGVTRAHAIGGRGDQYLHDLVPAHEGVVWAAVDNAYGGEIDENIDPILRVGSWSYDGAAELVLGLAY